MKKLFMILFIVLFTFSLTACGRSNKDTGYNANEDIIEELLRDYYGEYSSTTDTAKIIINEEGISYNNELLTIDSIGEDNYVKFKDSTVMFMLDDNQVSANFTNVNDQSYRELYTKVIASSQTDGSNSSGLAGQYIYEDGDQTHVVLISKRDDQLGYNASLFMSVRDMDNIDNCSNIYPTTAFTEDELKDDGQGIRSISLQTQQGNMCLLKFQNQALIYLEIDGVMAISLVAEK